MMEDSKWYITVKQKQILEDIVKETLEEVTERLDEVCSHQLPPITVGFALGEIRRTLRESLVEFLDLMVDVEMQEISHYTDEEINEHAR